jgi:hypothetical protein
MAKAWRCFFCDEVLTTRHDAWLHFGDEGCETDVPACVDPLRMDEKARMNELREARRYADQMREEAQSMEEKADLLVIFEQEIGRYFGMVGGVRASTPQQARLVLDAAQGEILALKQRLVDAGTPV